MEKRSGKIIVNKSGGTGSGVTFRATLPSSWVREMGLNEHERDMILEFDGKKITISKEEE